MSRLPSRFLPSRFRRFLLCQNAAITVEFVVVFPLMLAMLLAIVFISLLISTASDVQQVVHELARASFRYVGRADVPDICARLRQDLLPSLIKASLLLRADHFTLPNCPGQPNASGFVTISASYNFAGSTVQSLGKTFGYNLGIITRSSQILP